ncbi:MAG: lysylphosphatidylglycerol synthase transmembrane domain-containing protein [Longimicrobiales bacterium]
MERLRKPEPGNRWRTLSRFLGPVLLVVILIRVEPASIWSVLHRSHPVWLGIAVAATPLMLLLKAARWRTLLRGLGVSYPLGTAFLSYYVCLFIGNLTPGRLGEFVRAAHLVQDREVDPGRALSSVLVDRLFDLFALVLLGGLALSSLRGMEGFLLGMTGILFLMACTTVLLVLPRTGSFGRRERKGTRWGRRMTAFLGLLEGFRDGLLEIRPSSLVRAALLTLVANGIYFGLCFLLARSLSLGVGFLPVAGATALGSLVALIPITVAGLGTREAAITAFLHGQGVPPEGALGLSLLMFANFYLLSSAVGALLSLAKPVGTLRRPPSDPQSREQNRLGDAV